MIGTHRGRATVVAAVMLTAAIATACVPAKADDAGHDAAAEALFGQSVVPRLQVRLSEKAAESLRSEPSTWATCTLVENGDVVHERVAIKI